MFLFHQRRYFAMNFHCFQRSFSPASSSYQSPLVPVNLPSPMETHFWFVLPDQIRSSSLMNRYSELLSPCEKDHVLSMRGDQLRKSALLARALVRTTIARYTNSLVDPKSLKFRKNSYGKPENFLTCGVTVDAQIGIDVEEKARKIKSHVLAFARRYFSSHELEHLSAITDPEIQRQEFMKLWTLKEAYVKALGRGFSAAPFNTFTIRFRPVIPKGEIRILKDTDKKASEIIVESFDDPNILTSNWQFALMELDGSHYAAICMEKAKLVEGKELLPMRLSVRRTIPFVEDECITGTNLL